MSISSDLLLKLDTVECSVATSSRYDGNFRDSFFEIFSRVCRWKNFETRSQLSKYTI